MTRFALAAALAAFAASQADAQIVYAYPPGPNTTVVLPGPSYYSSYYTPGYVTSPRGVVVAPGVSAYSAAPVVSGFTPTPAYTYGSPYYSPAYTYSSGYYTPAFGYTGMRRYGR